MQPSFELKTARRLQGEKLAHLARDFLSAPLHDKGSTVSKPAEMAPTADELFLRNIDPTFSGEVEVGIDDLPQEYELHAEPRARSNGKAGEPRAQTVGQAVAQAVARNTEGSTLHAENDELRRNLAHTVSRLQALEHAQEQWQRREEEFDRLIEEKAEVIRHLHTQLQEAKIQAELCPPQDATPEESELKTMYDELLREREQLKLDEQELMEQMRNMEISMSRERAELARQRNELQLLHRELQHELEMASRDATLQERLAPLYKLQQEMGRKSVTESGMRPRRPLATPGAESTQTVADNPATKETKIVRRSGFFRRMFNRDQG